MLCTMTHANGDHGWRGRGKVRLARLDDHVILRLNEGAGSSSRALRQRLVPFFRKEARHLGPSHDSLAVTIWIETLAPRRRLDTDNVAKACLDALTGLLWRDDSQILRLTVEKVAGDGERLTIEVRPHRPEAGLRHLGDLLDRVDRLPPP